MNINQVDDNGLPLLPETESAANNSDDPSIRYSAGTFSDPLAKKLDIDSIPSPEEIHDLFMRGWKMVAHPFVSTPNSDTCSSCGNRRTNHIHESIRGL